MPGKDEVADAPPPIDEDLDDSGATVDDNHDGADVDLSEQDQQEPMGEDDSSMVGAPRPAVSVGSVSANQGSSVHIVDTFNNIANYCEATDEQHSLAALSLDHFESLDSQELEIRTQGMLQEREEAEQLFATLRSRHLLIIAGERVGKGMMALKAARQIWEQEQDSVKKVLLTSRISRDLRGARLDLLAKNKTNFAGHIVILEDALAFENRDLQHSIKDLNDSSLSGIEVNLKNNNTYIILTSDQYRLENHQSRLRSLGVLNIVEGPTRDNMLRKLRVLAEQLDASCSLSEKEREDIKHLLAERGAELVDRLKTMPQLVAFVHESLREVAAGQLELGEALRRQEDLSRWLLEELESPEALSLALALVLTQAAPPVGDTPWFQLNCLWRELLKHLRREMREAATKRSLRDLGASTTLLKEIRVEVLARTAPEAAAARFRDSTYPEKLWRVLLGSGRGLLSLFLPVLKRLMNESDSYLRDAAARAIGRIGEIDLDYVVIPMISKAARSQNRQDHDAIGKLFQGALGSANSTYYQTALQRLKDLTAKKPEQIRVRAVCLRDIGAYDLDLAINELKVLIEEKLSDLIACLGKIDELLRKQEVEVRKEAAKNGHTVLINELHDQEVEKVAQHLLQNPRVQHALDAVKLCLVELCVATAADPIQVFGKLLPFLESSPPSPECEYEKQPSFGVPSEGSGNPNQLAPLLGLIALAETGLVFMTGRSRVSFSGHQKGESCTISCSRILAAASLGQEEAQITLVRFLQAVYESVEILPDLVTNQLRDNLDSLLVGWAREAARSNVEELEHVIEEILARLLLYSDNRELRGRIFDLLQRHDAFATPESELRPLAVKVLNRRPASTIKAPQLLPKSPQIDHHSSH